MKISEYLYDLVGLGAVIFGIAGVGYGIGCRKRMNDTCDKINAKVAEISDNVDVDIPEAVIKVAVDNAVKEEVRYQVRDAVEEKYSDITKSVGAQVVKEVSNMDLSKLRKQIREDAAEKVSDKLENELDDIVEKFTNNLDSISTIYEKVADKMSTKSEDNEIKIRLM